MSDSSRRGFLKVAGVGGAAVGVGALVPGTAASAAPPPDARAESQADALPASAADTIVVHVTNARKGELTLMGEGHSVTVRDQKLAAQIASALHRNTARAVNASDADNR